MKRIYSALFFESLRYFDDGRRYPGQNKRKKAEPLPESVLAPLVAAQKKQIIKTEQNKIKRTEFSIDIPQALKDRVDEDDKIMAKADLLFLKEQIEEHLKCPDVFKNKPGFAINFIESNIVIRAMIMAQGHLKKYPHKMITLPVHDCLVCKKSDIKRVKKLLQLSSKAILKSPLPLPVK